MNYNKAELCKDCKKPVDKAKFRRGQYVNVPAPREWWGPYPDFRNARVTGRIERELSGNRYEVAVLRPDLMATQHIVAPEKDIRRSKYGAGGR